MVSDSTLHQARSIKRVNKVTAVTQNYSELESVEVHLKAMNAADWKLLSVVPMREGLQDKDLLMFWERWE
jgi:hypothetical protein